MYERPDTIPIADMVHRGIYRVFSRNLIVGVWDETTQGILGIREKFGDRYLFTEYHWDTGAPTGTANPLRLLGHVPEEVPLNEHFSLCADHSRPTKYRWSIPFAPHRGQWTHDDDGSVMPDEDRAIGKLNQTLFDLLLPCEATVLEEIRAEELARQAEQDSLKYKPLTREEHESKERSAAALAWVTAEMDQGRSYRDLADEYHQRRKGNA